MAHSIVTVISRPRNSPRDCASSRARSPPTLALHHSTQRPTALAQPYWQDPPIATVVSNSSILSIEELLQQQTQPQPSPFAPRAETSPSALSLRDCGLR